MIDPRVYTDVRIRRLKSGGYDYIAGYISSGPYDIDPCKECGNEVYHDRLCPVYQEKTPVKAREIIK
jgi:hypothetical protein